MTNNVMPDPKDTIGVREWIVCKLNKIENKLTAYSVFSKVNIRLLWGGMAAVFLVLMYLVFK